MVNKVSVLEFEVLDGQLRDITKKRFNGDYILLHRILSVSRAPIFKLRCVHARIYYVNIYINVDYNYTKS